jgi:hypothetical protein
MISRRIITATIGVLLFLSIFLTAVWLLSPADSEQELTFEQVAYGIENRKVKEINFNHHRIVVVDVSGRKYFTTADLDPARENLLNTVKVYNKNNPSAPVKYSEEPASGGWGWIVLTNTGLFFVMWAATLAVIVYAVRTLSRNKG